ncbi:hypothetical protein [Wansuia hejianensis]|uniref:Uncharacterized protein n=1 Tax=Wansuia hejianensis TaxID=2763667 RepID=A0A926IMI8_9FIRM|nr:hypothetical protein [Wansuia hejianensis]MBC8589708.1 hypothetical protein [Wansuia hejianensis]
MEETYPAEAFVPMTVCTDVTVTPFANELPPTTFCCGGPIVTPEPATCPGERNGDVKFTISQDICVKVPVEFGATTSVGDPVLTPISWGKYILTQDIQVKIPIEIMVKSKMCNSFIGCEKPPVNNRPEAPSFNNRKTPNVIIGNRDSC